MLKVITRFLVRVAERWMPDPLVTAAAIQLGADIPRVAMAVTIGEAWTNAIQPLYMVPVLAIAGLHIRDIMGFCVVALLIIGAIDLAALVLF